VVLTDLKTFLDENTAKIKDAVNALVAIVPQVGELIDSLINILNDLKVQVNKLDPAAIPNLAEAAAFAGRAQAFLASSRKLLPARADVIDDASDVAEVVAGLPALGAEVKAEIIALIDAIVANLNALKG
jgi:hypothetical protein